MRYLILSDLHANLEALQAVLAAAQGAYEQVVCCGDLVGYGPDPNPVVEWVRANVTAVVRGNHDKVCCGVMEAEEFSDVARQATDWTREQLKPEYVQYLRNLPQGPRDVDGEFAILHGSPGDEDEYLPSPSDARGSFELLRHRVSFFGHTHLQGGFICGKPPLKQVVEVNPRTVAENSSSDEKMRRILEIQADETYLLNPGSVGQPRDRDSRAAFAIYDTDGFVEYGRTSYDVETTMSKILEAGLPEFLAYRLVLGR